MTLVDKNIQGESASWSFVNIAENFDEHVCKSVPLYDDGQDLVCKLSDFFMPENATVVEIGTATGVLAEKFLSNVYRYRRRYLFFNEREAYPPFFDYIVDI